ncbi:glycosyltransferase [Paenibacillus amylolyticus]|uniref:Glycosyltransferase n=1 Tax=Paenibacillus amylolyticus TaxID=1451 RepID=A0A5M9WUE5_PAEAM|nr:glycosyltransferase family 2 protein [Paenibacillus amylolyticus]KAA8785108.1 glycosyltransferase [Paenibacillus amylolyticus]
MNVTVIIPVYGKPDVLHLTLQALAGQHYSDFSVWLVDQGGTIPFEQFRNAYEDKLRIHYIDTPAHTTVSDKRNRAIRESAEDVVIFLDADTIVCADFVGEHMALQCAGNEVVIGYIYGKKGMQREELNYEGKLEFEAFMRWFEHESRHIPDEREKYYEPVQDQLMRLQWPWAVFWSGNISVSRAALQRAGGFDHRFKGWGIEDIEVGYRLVQSGYELTLSRSAWAVHVPHEVDEAKRMQDQTANARMFLRKYPAMEIELYFLKVHDWRKVPDRGEAIAKAANKATVTATTSIADTLMQEDELTHGMQKIIQMVTSSYDTHFLLVGYDAKLFVLSQVSTLIDPRAMSEGLMNVSGKKVYRLAGSCMPFEALSFDVCIITPVWTMYNPEMIPHLLMEALRTSRVCYCLSPRTEILPLLAVLTSLKKLGRDIEYSIVDVVDQNMKLITCKDRGMIQVQEGGMLDDQGRYRHHSYI